MAFDLASHPWPDQGSRYYRVQILERKERYWVWPFYYFWETQWAAEAWAIGEGLQGYLDWIGADEIDAEFNVAVPELEGSRILFTDATGWSGGIQTELTGVTRWVY